MTLGRVSGSAALSGGNLYSSHIFSLTVMLAVVLGVIVTQRVLTTRRQHHCRLPVPGPVLRAVRAFAGLIFTTTI